MRKLARNGLIGLFWLGAWALAAAVVKLPLLLPGPWDTLRALLRLGGTGAFWQSTGMTLLRVAVGYTAAVAVGVALAVGCHFVPPLEAVLSPVRSVIKATPVSSFIILVLLWMEKGRVPAFISFLMVLPIIWTAVQGALAETSPQWIEMARAYGLSPLKRLGRLYAPAALPAFAAACMTGLGFAWKAGIAAEVIALPALSVGRNLYDAKIYLERADLFAWTLTVILLSMALEAALKAAIRRIKGGAA